MAKKHSTEPSARESVPGTSRASKGKQMGPDEPEPAAPQGAGPATGNGRDEAGNPQDRTERAEQLIDEFAQKVAQYTSVLGRQILRLGSRAREEAEDMWAEAQSIRRGH